MIHPEWGVGEKTTFRETAIDAKLAEIFAAMKTHNSQQSAFCRFSFAIALVLLLLAVATSPALGQTPPNPVPSQQQAFEVASVRLEDPSRKDTDTNSPNFQSNPNKFPSNVLVLRHIMLRSLICQAYGIDCGYVMGGPEFIDRLHYDLNAKVEGDVRLTREQMQPLMQNLLEERFHLKVHREQKIVPGYGLLSGLSPSLSNLRNLRAMQCMLRRLGLR